MRRPTAQWRSRVVGGLAVSAAGYGLAILLDFDPQPLPYAVWAVVLLTWGFLVVDTVDVEAASWSTGLSRSGDRVDEVTSDLRVLTSHRSADHPSDALQRRLVELARARDPALAAEVQDGLQQQGAGVQRLSPADIDRILTRIEDARDRT